MIEKSSPICLVASSRQEVELFMMGLGEAGYRRVTAFTSAREAYEVATRQQFQLFITRMEMPDMTGIVLIQKLRETGNYGPEPHLFVVDKLDAGILNILFEQDIPYVLAPPITRPSITQKFQHLIQTEANLPEFETRFREARAAFAQSMDEMAEDFVKAVLAAKPDLEKAIILQGDIEMKRGRYDAAMARYSHAARVNPKSAVAAHKLAKIYMAQGNHARAAMLLNTLAKLNPYNISLLENAGLSNLNAEKYEEAKAHMATLRAADETNKTAGTITAQVKIKQGDYTGLVDALKSSHDEKEIVQFLNNAGAKLSQGNDIPGALRMYESALQQLGKGKYRYAILYNMGIAYKRLGEKAKARTCFERSLQDNPEFEKAASALREAS